MHPFFKDPLANQPVNPSRLPKHKKRKPDINVFSSPPVIRKESMVKDVNKILDSESRKFRY